jgi:hypothetical protein
VSTSLLPTPVTRNPVVWALAAVTLGLVGVVVYTYLEYRQAATDLVLERDKQLTVLSAARLQSDLGDFADLLLLLARAPEMTSGSRTASVDALRASSPRLSVFDAGVTLLDDHGRVLATVPEDPARIGADWSNRDFFQAVLGGTPRAVSDAQTLAVDEPLVVAVAVPIRGEANQMHGALAGMFQLGSPTLSSFYATIVRLRLGQTGSTVVVDGTGRILYDSDGELVGHYLTSSRISMIAPPVPVARVDRDDEGHDVILAWAPVPGTDWTLMVEDDWAIVTQATGRYRDILLLSFMAALLLPPLMLALLSRQRRFRLPTAHRPEQDESWIKGVRGRLRPELPVLPGWNLHVQQVPGRRAEHEFYDAFVRPDGRLTLAIGRIAPTGIQAALALTTARAALRSGGLQLLSPGETLRQCNSLVCMQTSPSLSLHVLLLSLDPATGWMDFAVAGVGPPRLEGRFVLPSLSPGGQPLGAHTEAEAETGRLLVEPGMVGVLLGPSMLEARDGDGRDFVSTALTPVLTDSVGSQEQADRILDAFKVFNSRSPFFPPDLTILLVERLPLA